MTYDKEKYDAVFEILAAAEMQLRNGNYWQVAHKLEEAVVAVKKYAQGDISNVQIEGRPQQHGNRR